MKTLEIEVPNPSGIHARPAALFVRTAAGFRSKVTLENVTTGKGPARAGSMLEVMATGVSRGHVVRLRAEGEDEEVAIATLEELIRSGLGEAIE